MQGLKNSTSFASVRLLASLQLIGEFSVFGSVLAGWTGSVVSAWMHQKHLCL